MKKWPWWAWLAIGAVLGAAAVWGAIRGSEALGTPMWDEAVAWQGWAGSFAGALFAGLVAWVVLQKTLATDRKRMHEQLTAETEAARVQKRVDAWAEFIALAREYFRFPVDNDAFSALEHRTTAAFFRWSLYMPPEAQGTVDGVDVVLSQIIASARGDVREARRRGGAATHLRSRADDSIAGLVRHGNDLHRGGTAASEASAWFQERVDEAPWHFADRSS